MDIPQPGLLRCSTLLAFGVMQTSDASRISDDQVMNRLKTYSSSPGGLTHAFTLEMVQQAIKDWSLGRGETP